MSANVSPDLPPHPQTPMPRHHSLVPGLKTTAEQNGRFWIITGAVAFIGWVVEMSSLAAIQKEYDDATRRSNNQAFAAATGLAWWSLFVQLVVIIGVVLLVMGWSPMRDHRFSLLAMCTLGMCYLGINSNNARGEITSLSANASFGNVRGLLSSFNAYMAGTIMVSLSFMSWIMALGATNFAQPAFTFTLASLKRVKKSGSEEELGKSRMSVGDLMAYQQKPPMQQSQSQSASRQSSKYAQQAGATIQQPSTAKRRESMINHTVTNALSSSPTDADLSQVKRESSLLMARPSKVRALYKYNASPDDPNEVSFLKGEVMELLDNRGKWWSVKKQDGTSGIAPSNYLTAQ